MREDYPRRRPGFKGEGEWVLTTPSGLLQWGWAVAKILAFLALAVTVWPNPLLLIALVIVTVEVTFR